MKLLYRGYSASVSSSDRIGALCGEVSIDHDVIAFHALSVTDVESVFRQSIEDYLISCRELGREPDLPMAA